MLRWAGLGVAVTVTVAAHGRVPAQTTQPQAVCREGGQGALQAAFDQWLRVVREPQGEGREAVERRAEEVLGSVLALDAIGEATLGGRWEELRPHERERMREALTRAVRARILPYFEDFDELPMLRPAEEAWVERGSTVRARYWLMNSTWRDWATLELVAGPDGACRLADIRKDGASLVADLDREIGNLLDGHSLPYMIAKLGDHDTLVLADFEDDEIGALPRHWTWRDGDDDENKPYRVQQEAGNKYLEATDEGESVIIGREQPWDLDEYPYISFRVRVNRVPEGADERDDDKVDSAAGVYVTLNKKFFGKIPESVKYVWSSTLPVGTAVRREGVGRPWQVVIGSGTQGLGEWRTYVFDLRQAYRDTFGGSVPSKGIGIGVLSDANSMGGQAYADYDDFRLLRSAPQGVSSGVVEVVPPVKPR